MTMKALRTSQDGEHHRLPDRVRFKVAAGGVEKGDTWLASVSNKSAVITPIFSKLTLQEDIESQAR